MLTSWTVCQHIYKEYVLPKRKGVLFFWGGVVEFCDHVHIKAASAMGFPMKSSSQKTARLVSNYTSLCTLILKPFMQHNDFQSAKSSASWRQLCG